MTLTHEFNEDWKLRGRFQAQLNDGFYSGVDPSSLDEATGTLDRSSFFVPDYDGEVYFETLDITGRLSTWGLIHNLLVGADYYDVSYAEAPLVALDTPPFATPINIFNPVYGTVDVNALRNAPPTNHGLAFEFKWYGVYLQDQIAFGEQWRLLAGFRYD